MNPQPDRQLERIQHQALEGIQQPEGLISFGWTPPPTDLTPTGPLLATAEQNGYSLRVSRVFGETFKAILHSPSGDREAVATLESPSERSHLFMVKWAPGELALRVTCDSPQ